MSDSPLFTFVATSRNDDHGGDVLRRTQSFVRFLALQAQRHQVRCELILVDWNPPAPRAPLADVLAWPEGSPWFSAKCVTVPRAVHRKLKNSGSLAMFQMIAKNVGIRRASGDFIIATNIDIIFSDELFRWLKDAELVDGAIYRSDRWDMPNAVQLEPDFDRLLTRARKETFRKNLVDGTHVRGADGEFKNGTMPLIDQGLVNPLRARLEHLSTSSGSMTTADMSAELRETLRFLEQRRRLCSAPSLHTNGCGDFTMLSRKSWAALRGYPEWHVFSWAIDSVLIFQAYYNGLKTVTCPDDAVHYHIEHDYGSGWSPEGATSLWQRMDALGIPYIESDLWTSLVMDMQDAAGRGEFLVYNDLAWGLCDDDLNALTTAEKGIPARLALKRNQSKLNESPTEGLRRQPIDLSKVRTGDAFAGFGDGGPGSLHVRTHSHPWGYALLWDISDLMSGDNVWIEISCTPVQGPSTFGILNRDSTAFLTETTVFGAPALLRMRIKNPASAGWLVIRNAQDPSIEVRIDGAWVLSSGDGSPENADLEPSHVFASSPG